ncbi:MAG: DEAD/DEAH box helicase family protein [Crocinitomicaceae bacterium]|nr:DEAD/DEAH box helicase family protein [Crocinitomicaceae bacterium]
MDQFPSNIKFKFDWRTYQQRVLLELEEHLEDNHLHVIAPPGSGKTILGLEVMLRLNKPTVIFAPTVAIRNQWIQRFCDMFLQTDSIPEWISRDIKNPEFLTVSTYQGLHAAVTGIENEEEDESEEPELIDENSSETEGNSLNIIDLLKNKNIGTIVVDEAHHLKNAWWKSLTEIKEELNPTIVGLTATPPYDVAHHEWQRYLELNGPVDAEISVPELVVEGDLCPHQDYIYFSKPTEIELTKIVAHKKKIEKLFSEIQKDDQLITAILEHPIYTNPLEHLDWIYTNLECYSATLIFLNACGIEISKEHVEVIGNRNYTLPKLNYEWAEILLSFYLYEDFKQNPENEEHRKDLLGKLKRNGAIEKRSINFRHNRKIQSRLSSSLSKLRSIQEIVNFEYSQQKSDLRMVVLTDYIRKEFLVDSDVNDLEINKIGVLPIFELLRRENKPKLGVLTGSIIIIPISSLNLFEEISLQYGIESVSTSALPYDQKYLVVHSKDKIKHDIVHIVTQVFEKGEIEVLVGTKSLLGEGWDAPSINSLILASFVGSYVLSNQMRGRAIRTERLNQGKTGNIWHLVCIDPFDEDLGDDYSLLKRRFKSFVGISLDGTARIENGIGRMNLPERFSNSEIVSRINDNMLRCAGERQLLKERWHEALKSGRILVEEIKVPFPEEEKDYSGTKSMYLRKTIAYMVASMLSAFAVFGEFLLESFSRSMRNFRTPEDFWVWLSMAGVLFLGIFGGLLFKTLKLYLKYRDISKDIYQISQALLSSLIEFGHITTAPSDLKVVTTVDNSGAVFCHLEGGTTYDKSTFIKSLQEIVGTIDNPRYIIIRKNRMLLFLTQKDYHSVPEVLGKQKKLAVFFEEQWRKVVGNCQLVYTRTIKGRKIILKSRLHSLASEFEDRTERINKWR